MFDQVWKETCLLFHSLKTNLEPENEPLKKGFLLKAPLFSDSMLIFTGVLGAISHQDWWPGAVGWWSIGNLLGCTSWLQRHRNAYLAFQRSSWHSDALSRDEFQGNFKNGTHIPILLPYCKGFLWEWYGIGMGVPLLGGKLLEQFLFGQALGYLGLSPFRVYNSYQWRLIGIPY